MDAKAQRPITRRMRGTFSCWRIVGAGDHRLQRWECSDQQGTLVLDSRYIGEQSWQACTAPAGECQASAVHRGAAMTDLDYTFRCQRSDMLRHSIPAAAHQ